MLSTAPLTASSLWCATGAQAAVLANNVRREHSSKALFNACSLWSAPWLQLWQPSILHRLWQLCLWLHCRLQPLVIWHLQLWISLQPGLLQQHSIRRVRVPGRVPLLWAGSCSSTKATTSASACTATFDSANSANSLATTRHWHTCSKSAFRCGADLLRSSL